MGEVVRLQSERRHPQGTAVVLTPERQEQGWEALRQAGLSVRAFAQLCGLDPDTVSRFLAGKPVRAATRAQIARTVMAHPILRSTARAHVQANYERLGTVPCIEEGTRMR